MFCSWRQYRRPCCYKPCGCAGFRIGYIFHHLKFLSPISTIRGWLYGSRASWRTLRVSTTPIFTQINYQRMQRFLVPPASIFGVVQKGMVVHFCTKNCRRYYISVHLISPIYQWYESNHLTIILILSSLCSKKSEWGGFFYFIHLYRVSFVFSHL